VAPVHWKHGYRQKIDSIIGLPLPALVYYDALHHDHEHASISLDLMMYIYVLLLDTVSSTRIHYWSFALLVSLRTW
jgi:hypothetical protein